MRVEGSITANATIAITDDNAPRRSVDADIVGVAAELDLARRLV